VSPTSTTAEITGWSRGKGWGWVWGETDEIGALNALAADSVLAALRSVSEGRVFDLGLTLDRQSFIGPYAARTEVLSFRAAKDFKNEFGLDPEGVSFNQTVVSLSDHAGTQLDGLCHATFGVDNHWYNGYAYADHWTDFGARAATASRMPPIVLSAVLIDVAGREGVDSLAKSFEIGPDLLASTLAAQDVDIQPGEAVLIRTGALRGWGESGGDHAALAEPDTAGITLASARWLVEEKGAILLASDTSTLEVVPPVDGDNFAPVHKYLLVDQGVHIGELHYLEELAEARVYRCCYIALAPKLKGTTAGFALRPIAIV